MTLISIYQRPLFILLFLAFLAPISLLQTAVASERVSGIRVFLSNGDPQQAIRTSKALLAGEALSEDERYELLSLIADAEEIKSEAQHYGNVKKVVRALKTLEKEFPQRIDASAVLWRLAWLHWKHGDDKIALQEARKIRSDYSAEQESMQAAMLIARVYIKQRKWSEARSSLIQYGIGATRGSREENLAKAWLAVVDEAEGRFMPALMKLEQVHKKFPQIIQKDEQLFSRYVKVLYHEGRVSDALTQAGVFLDKFLTGEYTPKIRLLRADLWLQQHSVPKSRIEREYDILADQEAENSIGKQAFMRKLMLIHRDSQDYHTLKPVIIAFKRIANQNQLSPIENEALFNLAQLWQRLSVSDVEHAPTQAVTVALDDFSQVAKSDIKDFRMAALKQGQKLFEQRLAALKKAQSWTAMVALWERFPQFRRKNMQANKLQLAVAHGLRMLMAYEQAEDLLKELYIRADGSVWGQKVMLERARLWLDRGDHTGIERILHWLDEHEFTLYRPDMLLLVARMQLQESKYSASSQTIASVAVDDIAMEERDIYWKTRAEIAESLKRWHVAARAWKHYGELPGVDVEMALLQQANSLFKAKSYTQAQALYAEIKKDKRDAAWRYRYSICQLKAGENIAALERLEKLRLEKGAGIFASLATLAITDRKAAQLLKDYP